MKQIGRQSLATLVVATMLLVPILTLILISQNEIVEASPGTTFGYENAGGSSDFIEGTMRGSVFTSTGLDNETLDSITVYIVNTSDGDTYQCAIYLHSDNTLLTNGTTETRTDISGSDDWFTFSFSAPKPSLAEDEDYVLMARSEGTTEIAYDAGTSDQGHSQNDGLSEFPATATFVHDGDRKYSIYCTYTPEPQWNLIETWTGTIQVPVEWQLIENWSGTVEAPIVWQLVETWTGTVQAPFDTFGYEEIGLYAKNIIYSAETVIPSVYEVCGQEIGNENTEAVDNDTSTYWWHDSAENHWIILDLGETRTVTVIYIYNTSARYWGVAEGMIVYVTDNITDWGENVWEGELTKKTGWKTTGSFNKSGQWVKIVNRAVSDSEELFEVKVGVTTPPEERILGSVFVFTSGETGQVENITFHASMDADGHIKAAIYRHSNSSLVGETDELDVPSYLPENWYSLSFPDPKPVLYSNENYVLVLWGESEYGGIYLSYDDNGSANQGNFDSENYDNSYPTTASFVHDGAIKYSIYASHSPYVSAWQLIETWTGTVEVLAPTVTRIYAGDVDENWANNVHMPQDNMKIKVRVSFDGPIDNVYLEWYNGSTWENYLMDNAGGDNYTITMSSLENGRDYSFDVWVVAGGAKNESQWLRRDNNYALVRRYIGANYAIVDNLEYDQFYFHNVDYPDNCRDKRCLEHEQSTNGSVLDTNLMQRGVPTTIMYGHCDDFTLVYMNENLTISDGTTIENIYYYFWWYENFVEDNYVILYSSAESEVTNRYETLPHDNINIYRNENRKTYQIDGYHYDQYILNSGFWDLSDNSFDSNDIYNFSITLYRDLDHDIEWVSMEGMTSYIIINLLDNSTLAGMDSDSDGWDDNYELYTSYTNPFLADTDADGLQDNVDTDPLIPQASLYLPENNSEVDNTPYFEWIRAVNIDNHRLLVDNENTFSEPLNENRVFTTENSYTIPNENSLPKENYYWKIVTEWPGGSSETETWKFSVANIWQLIETWSGNVQAPATWGLAETWTGTIEGTAGWTVAETWSAISVIAEAMWVLIATWTGSIGAPASWTKVEEWAGTINNPSVAPSVENIYITEMDNTTIDNLYPETQYKFWIEVQDNNNLSDIENVTLVLYLDNENLADNVVDHYTFQWTRENGFEEVGPGAFLEKTGIVIDDNLQDYHDARLPSQHKAFYVKSRYWIFYDNNYSDTIVKRTSLDGESWSEPETLGSASPAAYFDVCYDGENFHLARQYPLDSGNLVYRKGTPLENGDINWSNNWQTVASGSDVWGDPIIDVDSDGYPWIGYVNDNLNPQVTKSDNKDGTWQTSSGFPYELKNFEDSRRYDAIPVPLGNGQVYVVYGYWDDATPATENHRLFGKLWDRGSWGNEENVSQSLPDDYFSSWSASAIDNDIHVVMFTTDGNIVYIKRIWGSGWENEENIQTGLGEYYDCVPTLLLDKDRNELWVFWTKGGASESYVYYKRNIGGVWDTTATWIDESTDHFPSTNRGRTMGSAFETYDNKVLVYYVTETNDSTPYKLKFAYKDLKNYDHLIGDNCVAGDDTKTQDNFIFAIEFGENATVTDADNWDVWIQVYDNSGNQDNEFFLNEFDILAVEEWQLIETWSSMSVIGEADWETIESWTGMSIVATSDWEMIEEWSGTITTVTEWTMIESWSSMSLTTTTGWTMIEEWSGSITTVGAWSLKEEWSGTVNATANWSSVETWSGTVNATASWTNVESWSSMSVQATTSWSLIESWTSMDVDTATVWTMVESWTSINLTTTGEWNMIESWTSITVNTTTGWTMVEEWSGTVQTSLVWSMVEEWSGIIEASASWSNVEEWSGTLSATASWSMVEDWTSMSLDATSDWTAIETWSSMSLQATVAWEIIETWTGSIITPTEWDMIEEWSGTISTSEAKTLEIIAKSLTGNQDNATVIIEVSYDDNSALENMNAELWLNDIYADNENVDLSDNLITFTNVNLPDNTDAITIKLENVKTATATRITENLLFTENTTANFTIDDATIDIYLDDYGIFTGTIASKATYISLNITAYLKYGGISYDNEDYTDNENWSLTAAPTASTVYDVEMYENATLMWSTPVTIYVSTVGPGGGGPGGGPYIPPPPPTHIIIITVVEADDIPTVLENENWEGLEGVIPLENVLIEGMLDNEVVVWDWTDNEGIVYIEVEEGEWTFRIGTVGYEDVIIKDRWVESDAELIVPLVKEEEGVEGPTALLGIVIGMLVIGIVVITAYLCLTKKETISKE